MTAYTDSQEVLSHPLLFEVSWEVCSQVGGIYTVLRSKAPAAARRWGEGYWLVGPYRETSALEFEPEMPRGRVGEVVREFREKGIRVHCGHWLITGRPQVLLFDVDSVAERHGEMKYFFWKDFGVGSPGEDIEFTRIVAFGYLLADFMEALHRRLGDQPMLVHCHEWQGAVALPLLKQCDLRFPTVFTTHATLVGRSLSAANVDLYTYLPGIGGEAVAREHQFSHRFLTERLAARSADVFTTVSDITALEAEQFLGRRPDALVPNGLNVDRFAAPHEFQNLHRESKELIHEFVMGHFFSSYTFDLDRTLYFFTAGRYEYRNKGLDMFIEALYRLNERLKAEPDGTTVVAFIISPARFWGFNVEALNRQAMANELRKTCEKIQEGMGRKLSQTIAHARLPTVDDLLDETTRMQLKRIIYAWRRRSLPPIVTHEIEDNTNDAVLRHLRHRRLFNCAEDPVKVVFHPEFINPTSPILGMEYEQFVRGCHLGVFPSYYEPWGYTPMECVARGIPTITSDLSGFGAWVMRHFPNHNDNGIYVANRRGKSFENTCDQIAHWMHDLTRMSRRERIQMRNRVESYAVHFDWENLARYYRKARRLAFQKYYPDREIPQLEADAENDTIPDGGNI